MFLFIFFVIIVGGALFAHVISKGTSQNYYGDSPRDSGKTNRGFYNAWED